MGKSKKHIIPEGQLNFFEELEKLGLSTSNSNSSISTNTSEKSEKKEDTCNLISKNSPDGSSVSESNFSPEPCQINLEKVDLSIPNSDTESQLLTKPENQEDSLCNLISKNSSDNSLESESNLSPESCPKNAEEAKSSTPKSDTQSELSAFLDENKSDNNSNLEVFVPDRFESLEIRTEKKKDDLKTIIVEVKDALAKLKNTYTHMKTAGRGAFWILRGDSGSGKSTFLHTANFFISEVETISLQEDESISSFLKKLDSIKSESLKMRIVVIENREALTDYSEPELEKDLHSINRFIRSKKGVGYLLVWPCNCDNLETILINLSKKIGAAALLGIEQSSYRFTGPLKRQYMQIAAQTIETLNEGATLIDFGVSEQRAKDLVEQVPTIGDYMILLLQEITKNQSNLLEKLSSRETFKMWIVVVGATDPEYEVAALTRGSLSQADITKLLSSTEANVVKKLKEKSEKIGILGTVLDSKIIYIPITTALSLARKYADDNLKAKMKKVNMQSSNVSADKQAEERLMKSELAKAFQLRPRGLGQRGYKSQESNKRAFEKLLEIAKNNDHLVNKTIGAALLDCKLVHYFQIEDSFNGKIEVKSDLLCRSENFPEPVRLEIMWRGEKGASCAQIANYVLKKLHNYGKAIGLLD